MRLSPPSIMVGVNNIQPKFGALYLNTIKNGVPDIIKISAPDGSGSGRIYVDEMPLFEVPPSEQPVNWQLYAHYKSPDVVDLERLVDPNDTNATDNEAEIRAKIAETLKNIASLNGVSARTITGELHPFSLDPQAIERTLPTYSFSVQTPPPQTHTERYRSQVFLKRSEQ